ncbi:sensor histidine kinase [Actinoplanes regularis]|uniref:Sensor-like histidine kinase SenX3 n=1 Tax=Actinoplanes regularis TaxID=52697 RepID=A0A239DSN8_9ACTN|nr:sensor histidine kinase [Actinoplanes regularis]SNS35209.1 His Kinase A (phospho-acceptor) domain-containing protein [Actinoplanes regularis]
MRFSRLLNRWRYAALPLVVWLVLTVAAVGTVAALERASRDALVTRFHDRVELVADFVTAFVDDLIDRQRQQAETFLSDPVVAERDFHRAVEGLRLSTAVLFDARGRVLLVDPTGKIPLGQDLTGLYPHLAVAVHQGRPAVSSAIIFTSERPPVVNLAVPFDTTTGRRVLAGSIEIVKSPLSAFLATAIPRSEVRLDLVDDAGTVVASNENGAGGSESTLLDAELAAAQRGHQQGRLRQDDQWWRYVTVDVAGTPWQLKAATTEDHWFAPMADTELGGRVALAVAVTTGLLLVVAVARTRRSRQDLHRANTQLGDFITMLSHDVRQPLSSIVSYGHILLDEWTDLDDEEKHRYIRRITTGGHRADHIVEEILTLSRLDAGAITAHPRPLNISRVIRQAVEGLGLDPGHAITVTTPDDEATAYADPAFLQLILGNLIGNAVKYGSPPIDITVTPEDGNLNIEVSDHGEGVPPQFVDRLFDRFARADTGVATTKPGTGLGLYLAHRLATASGLRIGYRPNQPQGATFIVTLPVTSPAVEPQRTAR